MSRRVRGAFRLTFRTLGELMITVGLMTVLFAGYAVWGKTEVIDSHQGQLDRQLEEQWGSAGDPPETAATVAPDPSKATPGRSRGPRPSGSSGSSGSSAGSGALPGAAIARLHIPKLGKRWVVVEGVGLRDIRYAPGHYPGTAQPGQVGNFAVAGHRTPAIFWRLDEVRSNDTIVVETRSSWFVYRVTEVGVVRPNEIDVIAADPGQAGQAPTAKMLTLTTCHPKWSNGHRLVVHAVMVRVQERTAGQPAELRS